MVPSNLSFYFVGLKLKLLSPDIIPQAAMTGGMVQEYSHTVLPSVSPLITLLATLLAMLVSVYDVFVSVFTAV